MPAKTQWERRQRLIVRIRTRLVAAGSNRGETQIPESSEIEDLSCLRYVRAVRAWIFVPDARQRQMRRCKGVASRATPSGVERFFDLPGQVPPARGRPRRPRNSIRDCAGWGNIRSPPSSPGTQPARSIPASACFNSVQPFFRPCADELRRDVQIFHWRPIERRQRPQFPQHPFQSSITCLPMAIPVNSRIVDYSVMSVSVMQCRVPHHSLETGRIRAADRGLPGLRIRCRIRRHAVSRAGEG